jgi:hypothetical protein
VQKNIRGSIAFVQLPLAFVWVIAGASMSIKSCSQARFPFPLLALRYILQRRAAAVAIGVEADINL